MRKQVLAAAACAALAGAQISQAAIIYSNNFNSENGGVTALNYTGFTGATVSSGSVDLVANGDFGLACAGGSGACVDLNGTTGQAGMLTFASFAFLPNTLYTLRFDLSGSQRGFDNGFRAGVAFDGSKTLNFYRIGGGFGSSDLFAGVSTTGASTSTLAPSAQPFTTFLIGFSAQSGGIATFSIGSLTASNFGPILDNVVIEGTRAVIPEPESWAMLIAGFGLVGAAARRRRSVFA